MICTRRKAIADIRLHLVLDGKEAARMVKFSETRRVRLIVKSSETRLAQMRDRMNLEKYLLKQLARQELCGEISDRVVRDIKMILYYTPQWVSQGMYTS